MQIVLRCHPDTSMTGIKYSFLKPARLRIRNEAGAESLVGYGVGEHIEVLAPAVQYLVCSYEKKKEIALADGSFVIEWPEDLKVVRV